MTRQVRIESRRGGRYTAWRHTTTRTKAFILLLLWQAFGSDGISVSSRLSLPLAHSSAWLSFNLALQSGQSVSARGSTQRPALFILFSSHARVCSVTRSTAALQFSARFIKHVSIGSLLHWDRFELIVAAHHLDLDPRRDVPS